MKSLNDLIWKDEEENVADNIGEPMKEFCMAAFCGPIYEPCIDNSPPNINIKLCGWYN